MKHVVRTYSPWPYARVTPRSRMPSRSMRNSTANRPRTISSRRCSKTNGIETKPMRVEPNSDQRVQAGERRDADGLRLQGLRGGRRIRRTTRSSSRARASRSRDSAYGAVVWGGEKVDDRRCAPRAATRMCTTSRPSSRRFFASSDLSAATPRTTKSTDPYRSHRARPSSRCGTASSTSRPAPRRSRSPRAFKRVVQRFDTSTPAGSRYARSTTDDSSGGNALSMPSAASPARTCSASAA